MDTLHHSLSYRSGGAVEMDPILKSGTLSMSLNRMQQDFTTIPSPLPCPFKQEIFWVTNLVRPVGIMF